jgi:hypothetical protein
MSRREARVGLVSVLLVLGTGFGPVNAQEPRRDMFEGLFGPPLRTPPSFSRPEATLPGTILPDSLRPRAAEEDSSAAPNEAASAPAEPSQADSTATTQAQDTSISDTPAPQPRPDAGKEGSVEKRHGTQSSQVRLNRRLGAKPMSGRQQAKSRAQAIGTARATRGSAAERAASVRGPELIGRRRLPEKALKKADAVLRFSEHLSAKQGEAKLAPRAAPVLPHSLMPRHARRE